MPSIQSSSEFTIEADRTKCRKFFTDLTNIGSCIPGCESVSQLDERTAIFRVRLGFGHISKTFELKAKFEETVSDAQVSFKGEGGDAEVLGKVDLLSAESPTSTVVRYSLEITPLSSVARAAVTMLGKEIVRKQAEEFASCAKAKIEKS